MLPEIDDPAHFDRWLATSPACELAVETIARRHGLSRGPWVKPALGSTLVFLSRDACIKLHPPLGAWLEAYRVEVAALQHVDGHLPIATPSVMAHGTLEGWPYFVATRIPGRPIDEVWPTASPATRRALAQQLGEAVAALHALPLPAGDTGDGWPAFVATQRAHALPRERARGLDEATAAALEAWLQRSDAAPLRPERALLHTELGPAHAFVDGDRVVGLIDFGEAMVGDPEYDLAAVGLFVTRGDADAFAAFGRGYGLEEVDLRDPDRPARLLRHALLHRYGTLAWYLDALRPPQRALPSLAAHWFGVGVS